MSDLAYYDYLTEELRNHELLGKWCGAVLYYPTVSGNRTKKGPHSRAYRQRKALSDLGLPALILSTTAPCLRKHGYAQKRANALIATASRFPRIKVRLGTTSSSAFVG